MMLGLYEKATPKNISWEERLWFVKELGFDYLELSIDETDDRISRLDWTDNQIQSVRDSMISTGIPILSMCLSAHRRFPMGSLELAIRNESQKILQKAVDLSVKLGIRTIQLAGYDVYYDKKSPQTREYFIRELQKAVYYAAQRQVVLAIEIMDDPFMNSITKFMEVKNQISSPWLQVYPDVGNLSAWPENHVQVEIEKGVQHIASIHLKDTLGVRENFPGKFKSVIFGQGEVDFLGILMTLKRVGYCGSFLVEMWSESDTNPEERVREALDYLLPLLEQSGYRR